MNSKTHTPTPTDRAPANRALVEALFSHSLISEAAREEGLAILCPPVAWALWVGRMLTALGVSLILSGVIYFFAFNWAKLTALVKLGSIELALSACLAGALALGLSRPAGKLLLLSASVLVGVFWAVFGQIYQTGADSYILFLVWAVMTSGFALIGDFAPLWAVWLAVANTAVALYWQQVVVPPPERETQILGVLTMFNLAFLTLREALVARGVPWLSGRWTRAVLVLAVVGLTLHPMMTFALTSAAGSAAPSTIQTAMLGFGLLAGFFVFYRYTSPDLFALGVVVLAASAVAECAVYRMLSHVFGDEGAGLFLSFSAVTVALFACLIALLRGVSRNVEAANAK